VKDLEISKPVNKTTYANTPHKCSIVFFNNHNNLWPKNGKLLPHKKGKLLITLILKLMTKIGGIKILRKITMLQRFSFTCLSWQIE